MKKKCKLLLSVAFALATYMAQGFNSETIIFQNFNNPASGKVTDAQLNKGMPANYLLLKGVGVLKWNQLANGKNSGIKIDNSAIRLIAYPDFLKKLDLAKDITIFIKLKLNESSKQKNGKTNWLFTRKRSYKPKDGNSWGIRYCRWGSFAFDIYGENKHEVLKFQVAHYKKVEGKTLGVFATFKAGKYISLRFYDEQGKFMNGQKFPTTIKKLNGGKSCAFLALSGAFWSNIKKPGGGFNGVINSYGIWSKSLTKIEETEIMQKLSTERILPQNAERYQQKEYFKINHQKDPKIIHIDYPVNKKLKVAAIIPFSGAFELKELYDRMNIDLNEVFVSVSIDGKTLGNSRSTWRKYLHVNGYYTDDIENKILAALAKNPDVIMIGNIKWKLIPLSVVKKITQLVKSGTGLVLACNTTGSTNPFRQEVQKPIEKTAILPYEIIPGLNLKKNNISNVYLGNYGLGKVIIFDYSKCSANKLIKQQNAWHCFSYPEGMASMKNNGWNYEFNLNFIIKNILNVAQIKLTAIIRSIVVDTHKLTNIKKIKITGSTTAIKQKITIFIRDDQNNFIAQKNVFTDETGDFTARFDLNNTGTFSTDILLYDKKGNSIDYAAKVFTINPFEKIVVKCDKDVFTNGSDITGSIKLGANSIAKKIIFRALDTHKRLLYSQELPVDKSELKWHFPLASPLSSRLFLKAKLLDAKNNVLCQGNSSCTIQRKKFFDNNFSLSIWMDLPNCYLSSKRFRELTLFNNIIIYQPHYSRQDIDFLKRGSTWALDNNMASVTPYLWRESYYAAKNKEDLIRKPCLSDPKYQDWRQQKIIKYGRVAKLFNPCFYSLGDEPYLVHFWKGVWGRDVCMSEHCLKLLRQALQKSYKSLDNLNKSWKTDYNAWHAVQPLTFAQATKHKSMAPWIDFRMHMTNIFMSAMSAAQKIITSKVDSQTKVGPEGMFAADPYKGFNWYTIAQKFDFIGGYGYAMNPYTNNLLIALAPQNKNHRKISISGWYPDCNLNNNIYSRYDPWCAFLHGQDGLLLFSAGSYNAVTAISNGIMPNQDLSNYWKEIFTESNIIRNRYYKLLKNLSRENSSVAIYYSTACTIASKYFTPKYNNRVLHQTQSEFWDRFLAGSSIDHTFIASEQVETGILSQKNAPKYLILPGIVALSEREVNAIKDFVNNGGIIIADIMPGIMNEHGEIRQNNPMEKVFGVKYISKSHKPVKISTTLKQNDHDIAQIDYGFKIQTIAGKTMLKINSLPAFTKHKFGKGKAFLTNIIAPDYKIMSMGDTSRPFKRFLLNYLVEAGIEAPYKINCNKDKLNNYLELITYNSGTNKYIAMLKNSRCSSIEKESFQLLFEKKYHIYNSITGTYLGFKDNLSGSVSGSSTQLFSLLPYKVKSISFKVSSQAQTGKNLDIDFIVTGEATKTVGNHALELKIFKAGKELKYYTDNILLESGHGAISLPLALNESGPLTIKIIDAASGLKFSEQIYIIK